MQKFISVLFFVLFLSCNLWAEAPKESLRVLSQGEPIAISSEKMTLKGQEDKVFFEGEVLIQKGDVKITAGRVEVLLADKDNVKEIVEIKMTEKVDVRQGDRRVLAQKGVYNTKGGEIVLTGDAEMWEKGYHVKGRLIRLSLNQKKSFVEGSILTIY